MARAGAYRELARFERFTEGVENALGSPGPAVWAPLITRKVQLREMAGKERIEAGAIADAAPATMRLRYDAGSARITVADRVIVRGRVWNIRSVIQMDDRRRQLEMILERGVAT